MSRIPSRSNEIRVGLLLLVAVGVFGWLSIQIGALRSFGDSVTVTARFADAAGLVADSAVKVAGVEVGGVKTLDVDFDSAVATLVLQSDAGLRSDVRAEIRARSLLGEKYVALVPISETAPLLQDGGVITNTVAPVEIDHLIASLGPLLQDVEPEEISRLIRSLASIAESLARNSDALSDDAAGLLSRLGDLAELAPVLKEDIPPLLAEARKLARHLDRTAGKADGLVDELGGTVERANTSLGKVDAALDGVPALIADAQGVVDTLEPSADDLARALESSDEAVARLETILKNFENFDEEALRRLLRQEGVLVRLRPEVEKRPRARP